MKAVCTRDASHGRFITVAHVSEDWVVDAQGNFIEEPEDPDRQTTHGPDAGNNWTCAVCGAEAEVTP